MILGTVNTNREAVVRLRLRGASGVDLHIDAVIDTGFTESLTLSSSLISALAFPHVNVERVTLADGSVVVVDLYQGTLEWDGRDHTIIVHCLQGNPLIGMSLLFDHLLTMQVVYGGPVSIDRIP